MYIAIVIKTPIAATWSHNHSIFDFRLFYVNRVDYCLRKALCYVYTDIRNVTSTSTGHTNTHTRARTPTLTRRTYRYSSPPLIVGAICCSADVTELMFCLYVRIACVYVTFSWRLEWEVRLVFALWQVFAGGQYDIGYFGWRKMMMGNFITVSSHGFLFHFCSCFALIRAHKDLGDLGFNMKKHLICFFLFGFAPTLNSICART